MTGKIPSEFKKALNYYFTSLLWVWSVTSRHTFCRAKPKETQSEGP